MTRKNIHIMNTTEISTRIHIDQNTDFKDYYRDAFLSPAKAFSRVVLDHRKLRFGLFSLLIMAGLYTCVYVFLYYGDGRPYKPWLPIASEKYYQYNIFFLAPSMLLAWLVSSLAVHIVARAFSKRASFKNVLSTFGLSIGVASWATLVHDYVTSFLGAIHIMNQQEYERLLNTPTIWRWLLIGQMLLYAIWFIVLFSKSVKTSYRTNQGLSFFLGVIGFITYQGFFLIFNR